jgi:hypothetical protein
MLGFNTTIQQRALRIIMGKANLVVLDRHLIASKLYRLMDGVLFIRVE